MATKAIARRTRTRYVKVKSRRRRNNITFPLAVVAPLAFSLVEVGKVAAKGNLDGALNVLSVRMTGYNIADGTWKLERMKYGAFPILGGLLVHKAANRLGLNRVLAASGVPFIRV